MESMLTGMSGMNNPLTENPRLVKRLGDSRPWNKGELQKTVRELRNRTVIGEQLDMLAEVKKFRPAETVLADTWGWARWDKLPTGDWLEKLKTMGFVKSAKFAGWFYRPGLDCGWGHNYSDISDVFKAHHAISV